VAQESAQNRKVLSQPAGVLDQLARREGGKAFQANVDACLLSSRSLPFYRIGQFKHQANIPTISDSLDNGVLDFSVCRDCPVIAHPHFTNVLNVEAQAPMLILAQFASVPVGILDAMKAIPTLETGISGFLSCLQVAKESRKGFIQAAQQMLQTGRIDLSKHLGIFTAHISEMRPLRSVSYSFARLPVGGNALFQSKIVDQPGLPKQEIQLFRLLIFRAKEVFVSTKHLLSRLLHFNITPYSILGDVTNRANVVAPAPQTWQAGAQSGELLAQDPGSMPLELVGKTLGCFGWVTLDEQVNMVGHDLKRFNRYPQFLRLLIQEGAQFFRNLTHQDLASVFRTPNKVIFQRENATCITSILCVTHRTSVLHHLILVHHLALSQRRCGLPLPPQDGSPRPLFLWIEGKTEQMGNFTRNAGIKTVSRRFTKSSFIKGVRFLFHRIRA
jgi:hypothetical protein